MRGDQLGRQWRIIRAIEASSIGLIVAEIANREEIGNLRALQAGGFPLYTGRVDQAKGWAFIDSFKFKILPPLILNGLMSLYCYKYLVRAFKGTPFHDSIDSVFKKIYSIPSPPDPCLSGLHEVCIQVGINPYKDYASSFCPFGSRSVLA